MTHYEIIQGDTKVAFSYILKDSAGNRIDISGASAVLTVNDLEKNDFVFTDALSIDDGPNGEFSYACGVSDTHWRKSGNFKGEVKITFSDGRILRFQDDTYKVSQKARVT